MRIFLLGFMGVGKTTLGLKLSQSLGLNFYDLDAYIEQEYGSTISDIFNYAGEAEFRKFEHLSLHNILQNDDYVLALGGGTPCFFDHMSLINEKGVSVYLKLCTEELEKRLKMSETERPLLNNFSSKSSNLRDFIFVKLAEREFFYNRAALIYDVKDIDFEVFVGTIKAYISAKLIT